MSVDNSIPNPTKHMFVRGDEYLLLPAYSKPWVVKHVVPSGGALNLYGKPKAGKSFAALGLALAIADPACDEWMGFPVEEHGRVAYFQIDTPRNSWQERIKRILKKNPQSEAALKNLYVADKSQIPTPFDITNLAHRDWLRDAITLLDPLVVIIDVIREVHAFDENDATPMKKVMSQLMVATEGYATIIISHSRKEQPLMNDDLMSDNRGSNYMAGRMDVVAKLTQKELHIQGRDTEYTKLPVRQRKGDGMVVMNLSEDAEVRMQQLQEVLKATKGMSLTERSALLAKTWGCSENTAKSRIWRFLEKNPTFDTDEEPMAPEEGGEGEMGCGKAKPKKK